MTREQRVRDLIAIWKPRLGISDWDIRYLDITDPAPDGEAACVYKEEHTRRGQIYIDPEAPDTHLEALVLHELLHIVLSDLKGLAMRCAGMGGKGSVTLMDEMDDREERAIDSIVVALCGTVPLFPSIYEGRHMAAFGERVA